MKKKNFVFIVIALLLSLSFIFSGCDIVIKGKKRIDFIVDNSIYTTIKTNGNEELHLPENPIKENYVFDGWYYDDVTFANKFNIQKFSTEKLEKNIRVYCKWVKQSTSKSFNISYVLYGGINNLLNPLNIESDRKYNLYSPTRDYFNFVGWYTESSFINKVEEINNIDKDTTLYAKWELKENLICNAVYGISMCPTINSTINNQNDYVIIESTKNYSIGDIIAAKVDQLNNYTIKRIIALGGDIVEINDKCDIYINNVRLNEDYVTMGNEYTYGKFMKLKEDYPELFEGNKMIIPSGQVFYLGDNRANSYDCFSYGPVSQDNLRGKVIKIISNEEYLRNYSMFV